MYWNSTKEKNRYLYLLLSYFTKSITKDKLPSTNSNLAYSSTISIGGPEENRTPVRNKPYITHYSLVNYSSSLRVRLIDESTLNYPMSFSSVPYRNRYSLSTLYYTIS